MTRYFIGILPPDQLAQRFDAWRQEYYPAAVKKVPVHITLVRPFYHLEESKRLEKLITQSIKGVKGFSIQLKQFGYFQRQRSVFYVRVEPSDPLCRLRWHLMHALENHLIIQPQREEYLHYHPHITIANHLNANQLALIQHQFQTEQVDEIVEVRGVVIFKKDTDLRYQIVSRAGLDIGC
jgi:2'-5' RNA ligase